MPKTDDFQDFIENPNQDLSRTNEEIIKEIDADNEKEYLRGIKKKNEGFLLSGLSILERERIARWICDQHEDALPEHRNISDEIDENDDIYRMTRKSMIDDDGDMPNYRTPISTVALEVMHANEMNVFFTPKDTVRVLPTEEGDIPKVRKLSIFANWSSDNELELFHQFDRLRHASKKNGESPYLMTWVKEYGTEIKREIIRNPANPQEALVDPDTQEPLYQEIEEQKLLYNAPRLEVISRKDYIQPRNAMMDKLPDWEMRYVRKTYDKYLREELEGKMFKGSIQDITDWEQDDTTDIGKEDFDGNWIPAGKWNQEFIEFYGRMRINVIKKDEEEDTEELEELEDEFIAIVHKDSQTLCQLRKNKFPLKMRPIGMDYFIPDDTGRRRGIGVMRFLENQQKSYDALFNQFIFGTIQSNNPFIFEEPTGNLKREDLKIRAGYRHFTSNAGSMKFFKIPPPDASIQVVLELIQQWAQLLFGISDFAAGMESTIDPDAPAKKAEIIIAQGNVRMNLMIKRANRTLKDIFKRWFLLYKENMPPNKYMRIVGESADNPWKFEAVSLEDFALKSLPDFEFVGNILNANKSLEVNKALAIYSTLITNPFFSPQTKQGQQSLFELTKWFMDKLDETGVSRFLPDVSGDNVITPEEENARFLQGDSGEPQQGEDHVGHIRVHRNMIIDQLVPEEIKTQLVLPHIQAHVKLMQQEIVIQQTVGEPAQREQPTQFPNQAEGGNGKPTRVRTSQIPTASGVL